MSSGISQEELAHEIERADAAVELLETVQAELALERAESERLDRELAFAKRTLDVVKDLSEQLSTVCKVGG